MKKKKKIKKLLMKIYNIKNNNNINKLFNNSYKYYFNIN